MRRFLIHWFVVAVCLAGTAWILPGVRVESLGALLVGSLVLGLVNALVRPVLVRDDPPGDMPRRRSRAAA